MRILRLTAALPFLFLMAPAGCRKAETPMVESKSETKSTHADGSRTTTTTEAKQVGSTLVSKTETTESGGKRQEKSETETIVGTVTEYGPGKRIVVLTGDGAKHDYDLTDKKTTSSIDPRVTVGTKVRLDSIRDDSGRRSVQVAPTNRG